MAVKTNSTTKKAATKSIAKKIVKKNVSTIKPASKPTIKRTVKARKTTSTKSVVSTKRNVTPTQNIGAYAGTVNAPQFLPFFNISFAKLPNGIKLQLTGNNLDAVTSLQNYFRVYQGSMVSLNILQNGVPWFNFNFVFGNCNWKATPNGVIFNCNTTDTEYLKALQSFVELANWSLKYGCTVCLNIGGNPICCCYSA